MGYDAVVVGAGHNGLVAACYLAKGGLRVLVLERREVVGGAAVTEELAPGFRVSTAAYSFSLFRPDVHRDLGLAAHGLSFYPKDPQMFVPLRDGRHFFIWRDARRTSDEIARLHPADGDAYPRWVAFWEEAVRLLRPFAEDPEPPSLADLEEEFRRRGRDDVWRLAVAGSAAECVEAFFRSEEVRGALASQGIIGTLAGPREPGTAWVMAYHYLGGELAGATGTWSYVRGGMGSVTQALASAAAGLGVEVRSGVDVTSIVVGAGRARGVRLPDGEEVTARVVLSNADPKRTFLGLVPSGALDDGFLERVRSWRCDGAVVKVNLALGELPDFTCRPGRGPQHDGTIEISPSLDYLERALDEARGGRYPLEPFMEVFLQSATDPTLAPEGKHVLSAFTQYAPAGIDPVEWPAERGAALDRVVTTLGAYAPNLPGAILASEVLGPPELEERFGLTGGDIFHGSILPEQCFGARFSYRTPLDGLYLCGSGAPPGGGVMGAAGRNAARTVLRDLGPP